MPYERTKMGDDGTVTTETLSVDEMDTVSMGATVDVSDMDAEQKEFFNALAELFETAFTESVEKNRDYGFSFLTTGSKLAQSDGTPFDHPLRSQMYGLLTRTGDKRERLIENVYGNGDASVSDDPSTTAMESGVYNMFMSLILEYPDLAQRLADPIEG